MSWAGQTPPWSSGTPTSPHGFGGTSPTGSTRSYGRRLILEMRLATPEADSKGSSARCIACSEVVVRGGVEPPTFRFSGVPSPLGPRSHKHRDNPAHRHRCWSMGLHRHHNDRAAVCHVVPFRLWASGGEPPGARTCGTSVGPGEARLGIAVAGARNLRQSSATSRHQVRQGVVTHSEQASSARAARRAQNADYGRLRCGAGACGRCPEHPDSAL